MITTPHPRRLTKEYKERKRHIVFKICCMKQRKFNKLISAYDEAITNAAHDLLSTIHDPRSTINE